MIIWWLYEVLLLLLLLPLLSLLPVAVRLVETIGLLNGLGTNVVNEQLQVETPPQQSASSINTEYTVIISTLLFSGGFPYGSAPLFQSMHKNKVKQRLFVLLPASRHRMGTEPKLKEKKIDPPQSVMNTISARGKTPESPDSGCELCVSRKSYVARQQPDPRHCEDSSARSFSDSLDLTTRYHYKSRNLSDAHVLGGRRNKVGENSRTPKISGRICLVKSAISSDKSLTSTLLSSTRDIGRKHIQRIKYNVPASKNDDAAQ
ncbi:uncharacterized protein TRIREDRAFT_106168 [Trichoderma reesei QM6a]|uniref:Predicted protein n=2 Tax=Hypocrea jecorina TaxID=51453 RepID=G0RGI0_HYPJQ|nr:uncharacterized protein TRIREDRAFT_106168 [Trichoderma reesei QM6a]EGR49864.1 predicted protein [Trichoderma reesei QM6a]ETS03559.1 hypothetical protein M419DRAFT_75637 [Trichoderma reesei RUT C-30]